MQRADRLAVDVQRHAEQRGHRIAERMALGPALRRDRAARFQDLGGEAALRQPPRPRRPSRPARPRPSGTRAAVPSSACSRIAARSTPSTSEMRTSSSLISSSNASEPSAASVMRCTAARRCVELLGLGALGLRLDERDALGLGPLAVAQVVHLHDQRRTRRARRPRPRRSCRRRGSARPPRRGARARSRSRAARPLPAPRAAPGRRRAGPRPRTRRTHARAARTPGGPAAPPSARFAWAMRPRAVQARHPDRRVLEDRAPQRLALAQRAASPRTARRTRRPSSAAPPGRTA